MGSTSQCLVNNTELPYGGFHTIFGMMVTDKKLGLVQTAVHCRQSIKTLKADFIMIEGWSSTSGDMFVPVLS